MRWDAGVEAVVFTPLNYRAADAKPYRGAGRGLEEGMPGMSYPRRYRLPRSHEPTRTPRKRVSGRVVSFREIARKWGTRLVKDPADGPL